MKPPYHPNEYALEFWDNNILRSYLYFGQLYSAKKFVEDVIDGAKFKWMSPRRIRIPRLNGMTIWCPELEEIMEYEYTSEEKAFKHLPPYDGYAKRLRGGEKVATPRNTHPDKTNEPRRSQDTPANTPALIARRKTMGSPALISLADLCEANAIDPRKARAILRRSKTPKPYEWEDATPILKLLRK